MEDKKSEPYFVKYGEIPYLGSLRIFNGPVSIFEKIDGSNCQVRNSDWRIYPGSRANYLTSRRWGNLDGYKAWMSHFRKWAMGNKSFFNLPDDVVVFGEWTVPREIKYPEEMEDKFYLIDVGFLSREGELAGFLHYDEAISFVNEYGLEDIHTLPEIRLPFADRREIEKILIEGPEQQLARENIEGIVIKDYDSTEQRFVKLLRSPYSEIQRNHRLNEHQKYSTTPRIRKAHYRLLESGLEDVDIGEEILIYEIREDIIKETGIEPDIEFLGKKIKRFMKRGV